MNSAIKVPISMLTTFLLATAPALAQSTMLSVSFTGDIARFSSTESEPLPAIDLSDVGGEAIGFTVGVSRAIGERWGVALEVGRSGEIEHRHSIEFDPRISARPALVPPGIPIPNFSFVSTSELQLTTISALAWVKHGAGSRVEISYAGGVSFGRAEVERSFEITDPRLAIWAVPAGLESLEYHTSPVAGIDAAIKFSDHTAMVAGVRLHGIEVQSVSGWLVRPSVGVRWAF